MSSCYVENTLLRCAYASLTISTAVFTVTSRCVWWCKAGLSTLQCQYQWQVCLSVFQVLQSVVVHTRDVDLLSSGDLSADVSTDSRLNTWDFWIPTTHNTTYTTPSSHTLYTLTSVWLLWIIKSVFNSDDSSLWATVVTKLEHYYTRRLKESLGTTASIKRVL